MSRHALTCMAIAALASCSGPSPTDQHAATGTAEHLTTGADMSADSTERRSDLLLQLQDRTGRFINLIDAEVGVLLLEQDLSPPERRWLRTLRTDAIQGILWAIQQEDVVDSEIETLFFSRMLHDLKSAQAADLLEADAAAAVESTLARADAVFWKPVEHVLGTWGDRISAAAAQYAAEHAHSPSVAFASSDLYVVADASAHRQLSGAFGLDARLEAAAQGIEHLNRTASRAVFLAEFAPTLMTRLAESAAANLVDDVASGEFGKLTAIPEHLSELLAQLTATLRTEQTALAEALRSTSGEIRSALEQLDTDLSNRVKDVDLAIDRQIQTLGGRLDGLNATAVALNSAVTALGKDVERLSSSVAHLASVVDDIPDDALATLSDPPAELRHAADRLESSLRVNVILAIAGTMAGCIVVSVVVMLLWRRLAG